MLVGVCHVCTSIDFGNKDISDWWRENYDRTMEVLVQFEEVGVGPEPPISALDKGTH